MNLLQNKYNFKNLFITFWFILCLTPLSSSQGISINYSYILSILILPLLGTKIIVPRPELLLIITIYFIIYVASFLIDQELFLDRFISFPIFISIFVFCFLKIDNLVTNFSDSLIFMALYLSISSLIMYITNEGFNIGMEGKAVFGSQRIGFIYICALWVILYGKRIDLFMFAIIFLILVGCFLTFNRTTILGIGGSISFWFILNGFFKKLNVRHVTLFLLVFFILFNFFDDVYVLLARDMFELALDSNRLESNLSDITSSEGARLNMWTRALNYIFEHPILGSGFMGFKILEEGGVGSAHSQYIDVLFRVGFFGFFIWIYLVYKILLITYKKFPGLFYGFIGTLFFGIFNETFKLSQGAFIFAFLIGIYSNIHSHNFKLYKAI